MPKRAHLLVELAVDIVVLTVREHRLQTLVIERDNEPFRGSSSLPGGFLRSGESPDQAAVRELSEETGLGPTVLSGDCLEQLRTYGEPERDPRGRVVTVAYMALMPDLPMPLAGSDAARADWRPVQDVQGSLAFDHDQILADAVERARSLLEMTTRATSFCRDQFTVGELREVYEVVWGVTLDPRNFSRKVLGAEGFVRPTRQRRAPAVGRPAALYESGAAVRLSPPLMRG